MTRLLFAAPLLLFACDPGPTRDDAVGEVGAGATSFAALVDGDEMSVESGLQGGFHLVVHARAHGIDPGEPTTPGGPDNPHTFFTAYREDGSQLSLDAPPHRVGYRAVEDEWVALESGRILQLDIESVDDIDGESVLIVLDIEDRDGRRARDERQVVAVAP